tara:strand:+ start:9481 stop:10845 length:1365 start_codon:yes stop_codon:yes gene_type:complete
MRYIPHTERDIQQMLSRLGVPEIASLFDSIPQALRLEKPLELPDGLAEAELVAAMRRLQRHNFDPDEYIQFIGAGAYRHFTPSVINHLTSRSEFSTSYTPYQPEVSQGTLQAVFEFQTLVCMLTGMGIANASMYDGASALAEAVLMANRINGKPRVLLSSALHPEYRQVVGTYLRANGMEIREIPYTTDGKTNLKALLDGANGETTAVVLQTPNFFGAVEEYTGLGDALKEKNILLIVCVTEGISLGILKPPGERGADIVVGEGQSFGLPVSYGGPYVGFFASRENFIRQMPGRLAGETLDTEGRRAFVLTLSTREQHIRREKATSNICTNQGLCALAATIFLCVMGKKGMREIAEINLKKAEYLKKRLAKINGYSIRFSAYTFNEFVLECPESAETVREKLLEENIIAGLPLGDYYPELKNGLLLCVTEANTTEEIDRLVDKLEQLGSKINHA